MSKMNPETAAAPETRSESHTQVGELLPLPDSQQALIPASSLPEYIGIALQTLARWRHEGYGPRYVKLGRRVFYRSGDIRTWIDKGAVGETDVPTLKK
jgi:predicted DNA-binding transcriptional regulator AlpA